VHNVVMKQTNIAEKETFPFISIMVKACIQYCELRKNAAAPK